MAFGEMVDHLVVSLFRDDIEYKDAVDISQLNRFSALEVSIVCLTILGNALIIFGM